MDTSLGLSNTWVLLHLIDGNVVVPNGYKAIRLAHVSQIKVDEGFVDGYLRLRGMRSESLPWIRLNDLSSLLFSVSENYPLFMIETECKEPGIGFVGRIEKLTKRNIWLEKIKSTTEWIGVEKFKLKDITCVDFGDGYVEALAWGGRLSAGSAAKPMNIKIPDLSLVVLIGASGSGKSSFARGAFQGYRNAVVRLLPGAGV